ncbi:MAG: trehalase [Bacteroidetes bacterium]|nr:trehalase [Bacteroidota bacterium]
MQVIVDVDKNIKRLLQAEDTDNDRKITIEDKGSRRFLLEDSEGKTFEVCGTFQLSVLLQDLYLAKEAGKKEVELTGKQIFLLPVERVSGVIKKYFWDGLTRSIDETNLENALKDSKTSSDKNYVYIPFKDRIAFNYFKSIEKRRKDLNILVIRLPEKLSDEYLNSLNKKPGLLVLALIKSKKGIIKGRPFVVPGGRFNEMYGWDSYFESLGLIEDGRIELALSMAENFFYEIEHYGKILNANRTYYLNRSQPPFLTSMLIELWKNSERKNLNWLKKALNSAIKEYETIWVQSDRLTNTGLSRYYGASSGIPQETEPAHFNQVLKPFAEKNGLSIEVFRNKYLNNEIYEPELEEYFLHDRSVRESGHDTSYRLEGICAHLNTVDLNSLLYKYETDIACFIKNEFKDRFYFNGKTYSSEFWFKLAAKRRKTMVDLMWDKQSGFFFDYNFVTKKRTGYESATTFYPLWANLSSKKQAEILVEKALPLLEEAGGVAASTERSRGPINEQRPARQWDYPYGWAPHQMLIWKGLSDYGYKKHAERLAYKWLYTILRNFVDYNGTIPEKYDVVNRTHKVFAEYGNVGTDFQYITKEGFGWMNASFQIGLKYLSKKLIVKLNELIPPEWIFKNNFRGKR